MFGNLFKRILIICYECNGPVINRLEPIKYPLKVGHRGPSAASQHTAAYLWKISFNIYCYIYFIPLPQLLSAPRPQLLNPPSPTAQPGVNPLP